MLPTTYRFAWVAQVLYHVGFIDVGLPLSSKHTPVIYKYPHNKSQVLRCTAHTGDPLYSDERPLDHTTPAKPGGFIIYLFG